MALWHLSSSIWQMPPWARRSCAAGRILTSWWEDNKAFEWRPPPSSPPGLPDTFWFGPSLTQKPEHTAHRKKKSNSSFYFVKIKSMSMTWPSSWHELNIQCTVIRVLLALFLRSFWGICLWIPVLQSGSPASFFGKHAKGFLVFVLETSSGCLWAILHELRPVQTGEMN